MGNIWKGCPLTKSSLTGSLNKEDIIFDDNESFIQQPNLPVGIRVCAGDVIDSIEFLYNKEMCPRGGSVFFHGGPNGKEHLFWLEEGEYIYDIELEYGKYIFSLDPAERVDDVLVRVRFTTSAGRSGGWYGNECGKGDKLEVHKERITLQNHDGVCCFYGATCKPNMQLHNYVKQLGVYYIYRG